MTFKDFTITLATSLHAQRWTAKDLEQHLLLRLPQPHRHAAAKIAASLINAHPKAYAPSPPSIAETLKPLRAVQRLFEYVQQHGDWPDQYVEPNRFTPLPVFEDLSIPPLDNTDALAEWLALDPHELVRFADLRGLSNATDNAFAPHYRFQMHRKRDGTQRLIEEPKPLLKKLQRRVLQGILNSVPPSPSSYGFVPGRNCIRAAAQHAGEDVLVCFDLKLFFPSIRIPRITGLFRCLGYPEPVARTLAGLCTLETPRHIRSKVPMEAHRLAQRHLPQGAPTSPALANLCCFNMDKRLAALARSLDANFTRYADDLAFSGDRHIVTTLRHAVPDIVGDERFHLNTEKTRVAYRHQSQVCTGITVNEKINIPRRDYDLLKAAIHRLSDPQNADRNIPAILNALCGRISWVENLNPAKGAILRRRFDAALAVTTSPHP
ncbi:reverse transcriptase family protein [Phaeobacter sp. C3_T13_0]|uniref:reverse transcriptase family protein n=1 Tax=Phaeobacter cretensis TaxID=3342641 RepID=UPI0039BC498B